MLKYIVVIILLSVIALVVPSFAQEDNKTNTSELQVNATTGEPILQQKSDRGVYNVLLKWPEAIVNPESGIQVEIVFLNASSPSPDASNIPQGETNDTIETAAQDPGFNVPGIIEPTLAVQSYDIAIYDKGGNELWKKVDQPGLGGRGTQDIAFGGNVTGPITIKISDIKPGWLPPGSSEASNLIDSVAFTTSVVPEFPITSLLFAVVIATAIGALRFKSRIAGLR